MFFLCVSFDFKTRFFLQLKKQIEGAIKNDESYCV